MTGRDRIISRSTGDESPTGTVLGFLKTGVAILVVFGALGLVAKTAYDALPTDLAFPGLLVALALLGFGGLYAVLRIRDWLRR